MTSYYFRMTNKKIHICNICNKEYINYKSYWQHNKSFHSDKSEPKETVNKTLVCKYCNKSFNFRQNKYQHEKICKKKNIQTEIILPPENKIESQTVNTTINNIQNINNNTINNNITNNIIINEFGGESIDKLTIKDIKKLAKMNLNAFTYIIKLLNFDKNYPENHSFCTTSLEGNYVNYYNKKKKKVEKMNKKDFLDKVLLVALHP